MSCTKFSQETLAEIVSVCHRLIVVTHGATKNVGNSDTVRRACLSRELQRIVIASETIVKMLNDSDSESFPMRSTFDGRLRDWLSGKEPAICLNALHQMEKMLRPPTGSERRGRVPVFQRRDAFSFVEAQDGINDAISVFDKQQGYFHFLLASDVWGSVLAAVVDQERGEIAGLNVQEPVEEKVDPEQLDTTALHDVSDAGQSVRLHSPKTPETPIEESDSEELDTPEESCDSSASSESEEDVDSEEVYTSEQSADLSASSGSTRSEDSEESDSEEVYASERSSNVPTSSESDSEEHDTSEGSSDTSASPGSTWSQEETDSEESDTPERWLGASGTGEYVGTGQRKKPRKHFNLNAPLFPDEEVDPKKLNALVQWLDAFHCERHTETFAQRQPGTCTWLPGMDTYKAWRRGEDTFLWLQGKAGAGKSVVAASIIEDLTISLQDDERLAFFYFDFRNERSTGAAEAMRSILSQLLGQLRGMTGSDPITLINDLTSEKDRSFTILRDVVRLAHFVSRTGKQFTRPPLIVIDGLDECKDIEDLLPSLRQLSKDGLRLFVTGRPSQVIKNGLVGVMSISMGTMAEAVSADMLLHIVREVDYHRQLRLLSAELKDDIYSTLQGKADGVFRWIQCQIDTLKECVTVGDVRSTLETLPMGLEATYAKILHAIDQTPSETKLVQRALAWLVAALRPLKLLEIVEAVSINLDRRILNRGIRPVHGTALLDALSSLVVYNEETDIVTLSHSTVKEYLMGELTLAVPTAFRVESERSHAYVSRLCMCYIAASLKQQHVALDKQEPPDETTLRKSQPLLDYVLVCGVNHLARLDPLGNREVLDTMIALRSDIRRYPSEWEQMCKLASTYPRYKPWLAPKRDFVIGILVVSLPEQFLSAFFDRVRSKASNGLEMLIYATHFCKIDHARILVARHVNVDGLGWNVDKSRKVSPLEVALIRGHRVLVDLFLLNWNATVPWTLLSNVFCCQQCPYHPALVARLLQTDECAEWAADVDDRASLLCVLDQGRYRRYRMTQKYFLVMLRRLVQLECDLAGTASFGQILRILTWAASRGYTMVLEYLLSLEVPIPSRVLFSERTAKLVRRLSRHGIDVHELAASGDALLHHVLGCCMGGASCWAAQCKPCSIFRSPSTQSGNEIDIHFCGKMGIGSGSLVDMIMGIPNHTAQVSRNPVENTKDATNSYLALLGTGSCCRLWDMQGISDAYPCSEFVDRVCQLSTAPFPILVWCMDSSNLDDSLSWKQVRNIYMECYRRRVKPMVVIMRADPESATDWEGKCKHQLRQLYLEEGCIETNHVLGRVRNHDGVSCPEYIEDSLVLRDVIYRYAQRHSLDSDPDLSEYSDEILEHMSSLEDDVKPNPDYMDRQTEFTWHEREILTDWLIEVHQTFELHPETLWITANIIDRFLTRRVVSLAKLQLIAVTAVSIAAKYEEPSLAPYISELVFITKDAYSVDEIFKAECSVLRQLDFKLSHYYTPYPWLRRINMAKSSTASTSVLSEFLAEVTLFERRFLRYSPRRVAAVAVYSARTMIGGDWDAGFMYYSGFAVECLEVGHRWICRKLLEDGFVTRYVYKKHSVKKHGKASVFALQWTKANSSELELECDRDSDSDSDGSVDNDNLDEEDL